MDTIMAERCVSDSSDATQVLKSILEWTVQLLGVDAGEIYLYDPRKQYLTLSVACGAVEAYVGTILLPGEGLAGKVFSSGQPILIDDYWVWEGRATKFGAQPPFQAELGVPLRWQDRLIGVLVIVADTRKRALTAADVQPTTLVANLVSVGIQNARLYRELQGSLRQFKQTLEQEIAERIAELARQTVEVTTSVAVGGEGAPNMNTHELLERVIELRTTKKVLANLAAVRLEGPSLADLTPREVEILTLVARGLGNKEIAHTLSLAVSTVKFHIGSILGKLSLSDRTQAALWAVRAGLVKPDNHSPDS